MSEVVSVEIEEKGNTERHLKISVAASAVDGHYQKALAATQKKVNIKGFRKGKAPLAMVEKLYGGEIESDAIYRLLDFSYGEAVGRVALRIVGRPVIQDLSFRPGEPFQYVAKVEVLPEIQLKKFKGLEINVFREEVSEADIDAEVNHLRDTHAQLVPVEPARPVATGDFVIIDCVGRADGNEIPELTGQNLTLEMGKGVAFPGFEDKILGAAIDEERDFELIYPAEESHDLAGKPIQFHIRIREMKTKVLPELNDDFARDLGGFTSIDDLRGKIREQMLKNLQEHGRNFVQSQIMDKLVEANSFDAPQVLVEEEFKGMIEDLKKNLAARQQTLDESDPHWHDLEKDYRQKALKRVQAGLLLDAVAKAAGIEVNDADVEQSLQRISERLQRPVEEVRRYYREPKPAEALRLKSLEEKTLEFLRENAKIIKKIDASGPQKVHQSDPE